MFSSKLLPGLEMLRTRLPFMSPQSSKHLRGGARDHRYVETGEWCIVSVCCIELYGGVGVKRGIGRRDKQEKTDGEMVAAIDSQKGESKKKIKLWEVTMSMRLAGHQSSGGFSSQTGKWL